jgi:Domain of unknown function (DUF6894)
MPAYLFHVDHGQPDLDEDGTDLTDIAEARYQAIDVLANLLRNGAGEAVLNGTPLTLWVTDGPGGTGARLLTVCVSTSPR